MVKLGAKVPDTTGEHEGQQKTSPTQSKCGKFWYSTGQFECARYTAGGPSILQGTLWLEGIGRRLIETQGRHQGWHSLGWVLEIPSRAHTTPVTQLRDLRGRRAYQAGARSSASYVVGRRWQQAIA